MIAEIITLITVALAIWYGKAWLEYLRSLKEQQS